MEPVFEVDLDVSSSDKREDIEESSSIGIEAVFKFCLLEFCLSFIRSFQIFL